MKIFLVICAALFISAGSAYAGYRYGAGSGYDSGRKAGIKAANEAADAGDEYLISSMRQNITDLESENERLVSDYNKLAEQANAALSRPVYQPRQNLNCTTSNVGTYAYTNCY